MHKAYGYAARNKIMLACLVMCLVVCLMVMNTPNAYAADNQPNEIDQQQTTDSSFLYDTTISDLVNSDTSRQGSTVQVTGEVVGDSVSADQDSGKHWITLDAPQGENSGSISVLIDDADLSLIDTYGEYGSRGTMLRVRGTFYMTCPTHEGIIDIHADNVERVEDGYSTPDTLNMDNFIPGALTCAAAVLLMVLYHFLRERQR